MATINFTQVEELPSEYSLGQIAGCNVLTDLSIILHRTRTDGSGEKTNEFYRSTDNGLTWTFRSDFLGWSLLSHVRMVNLPENVLLFPRSDINTNEVEIMRSTNAAASWTSVATYPIASNPPQLIHGGAALGHSRNSAIFGGYFERSSTAGYNAKLIFSDDTGLTWSDLPHIALGGASDIVSVLANGAKGNLIAGADTSSYFLSDDFGQSWTPAGAQAPYPGTAETRARAACWITEDIVLTGGSYSNATSETPPWLWRSTDKGISWTLIPNTSLSGWPSSGSATQIHELHRITRDGAILGTSRAVNRAVGPWWISLDAGVTWFPPNDGGHDWSNEQPVATGAICISPDGHIIAPLLNKSSLGNKMQIWRGTFEC